MSEAKSGDTVRVHYTGKLDDGTVFDTSRERDPLEFTLGEQQVIPGFENAVDGMAPGDTETARLEPEDAYGERHDEMVFEVERSEFADAPNLPEPEVGQQFQLQQGDNQIPVTVKEVGEEKVVLDANHPLAGEALTFEVELLEIV